MENLVGTEFNMELNLDAMQGLVQRLTDLYSNPIEATVRELVSNAFDTTRKLPKADRKPIRVSAPTELNPAFVVQDFGEGMTKETVETVYAQYGASTKKDDDTQIGAYGLGAKAPLSYASKFVVRTVRDGQVTEVFMTTGEEGNFCEIIQSKDSKEPNGTTVTIPVEQDDFDEFARAVDTYSRFMSKDEILVYNSVKDIDMEYQELSGNGIRLWIKKNDYSQREVSNLFQNLSALSDTNARNVGYNKLGLVLSGWVYTIRGESKNPPFLIEIDPNKFKFTSSRDDILLDEEGFRELDLLLTKAVSTILLKLNADFDYLNLEEKVKFLKIATFLPDNDLTKNKKFLDNKLPNTKKPTTFKSLLDVQKKLKTEVSFFLTSSSNATVYSYKGEVIKAVDFKSFVQNAMEDNKVIDKYPQAISDISGCIFSEYDYRVRGEKVLVIEVESEKEILPIVDKIKTYIKHNLDYARYLVTFVKTENLKSFESYNDIILTHSAPNVTHLKGKEIIEFQPVVREEYKGCKVILEEETDFFDYLSNKVTIDTPKEENAIVLAQNRSHFEKAIIHLMKHHEKIKYIYVIKSHSIKKNQVKNFVNSATVFMSLDIAELNFMSDLAEKEIKPLIVDISSTMINSGDVISLGNQSLDCYYRLAISQAEKDILTPSAYYYANFNKLSSLNLIEFTGKPKNKIERKILFLQENMATLTLIGHNLTGGLRDEFVAEYSKI